MLFRGTQDGRVLAYDFKTGKRLWETTIADPKRGESVPSAPIAWRRPRLRRQRGRRLQGRQGPHVRARRQDRQDRLGVLSGSQGRGRHRPRTAGRDAARRIEVEERAGHPDQRWRHLDVLHARHRRPGCSTSPAAIRPPISSIGVREGDNLLHRLGRRARRQDRGLQESFPGCEEGLARLGRLQPAHPDPNHGRQAAHGRRAEGRLPLWLRSRHQQAALPGAGDPDRGVCRGSSRPAPTSISVRARSGVRNGTARPTIPERTSSSSARSNGAIR